MNDDPTLLLTHTVGPDQGPTLRDALVDAGVPANAVEVAVTPADTDERVADADALLTGRLSADLLSRADSVRWVQALSAGVDSYPLEELEDRDVALTNASGVHAEPIAEQTLGYMLTFERELHAFARQQADRRWESRSGGELRGKTLGVVGVGAIGARVAELGSAFGMEVLGTKRDLDSVPDAVDEAFPADEYATVCERSDYLVLACPLTEETEGMIGTDELRLLGDDGVLVNVARGEVCEEEALTRALQSHTVRGAALDVFAEEPLPEESPLWNLSNVVVTPHMAGSTPRKVERLAVIAADNYERFAAGEELRNRVL